MKRWMVIPALLIALLLAIIQQESDHSDRVSREKAEQREQVAQLANEMCDTNEGGYYHIDQNCVNGYMATLDP